MIADLNKRVIVVYVPSKYKTCNIMNLTGTIKELTQDHDNGGYIFGVELDGKRNPASAKGLYWLKKDEIKVIKGDTIMNISNIGKNYKFCTVIKPGTNATPVEFQAYQGELKENDYVICNNHYGNGSLSVRIVLKTDVPRDEVECLDGEIMGVADTTGYFERKENERRADELKKKMMERAKAYQEEAFWRMMAKEDPQMAELLAEYEEVNG